MFESRETFYITDSDITDIKCILIFLLAVLRVGILKHISKKKHFFDIGKNI